MWTARAKPPNGRAIRPLPAAAPVRARPHHLGINGVNYAKTINDNMLVVVMIETPDRRGERLRHCVRTGYRRGDHRQQRSQRLLRVPQDDDRYQAMIKKVHDDVQARGQDLRPGQCHLLQRPSAEQRFVLLPERAVEGRLEASQHHQQHCSAAGRGVDRGQGQEKVASRRPIGKRNRLPHHSSRLRLSNRC